MPANLCGSRPLSESGVRPLASTGSIRRTRFGDLGLSMVLSICAARGTHKSIQGALVPSDIPFAHVPANLHCVATSGTPTRKMLDAGHSVVLELQGSGNP